MLSKIAEVVTAIGNFISSVVEFIIEFISDIYSVIKLIGTVIVKLPDYFGWLPVSAVTLILTIFGVVVIYKVTGREG